MRRQRFRRTVLDAQYATDSALAGFCWLPADFQFERGTPTEPTFATSVIIGMNLSAFDLPIGDRPKSGEELLSN